MSVLVPFPVGSVEQEKAQPSLTYRLDPDRKRIVGRVDKLDAVNQAIRKALITPRFRCLVYGNQYGSEIKETVIAGDASREYIETDLPRLVKDALLVDSRILDVYAFSFAFSDEQVLIKFTADTIFGTAVVEEVV